MPPQNNQPEKIAPGISAPTPEMSQNPPTFGEVLAKQNVENVHSEEKLIEPETAVETKAVQIEKENPKPIEKKAPLETEVRTDTVVSTPEELVDKFKAIEKMADDPDAEQKAFKKAQTEYLRSLGEDVDTAA